MGVLISDVFNSNIFADTTLTQGINKQPYSPSLLEELGIFEENNLLMRSFFLEEISGTLSLIPAGSYGGLGTLASRPSRRALPFQTIAYPFDDALTFASLEGIRAFGKQELETIQTALTNKQMAMAKNHDYTREYIRMKSLQGAILDSNGSTTLLNVFTAFNLTQQTKDFVFDTSTTDILAACLDVRQKIQTKLGVLGPSSIQVVAVCGATWFSKLIAHARVRDIYLNVMGMPNRSILDSDIRFTGFEFGGIRFIQYRQDGASPTFISADEAYAFPINTPGLYQSYYAPAPFEDTMGKPGLPIYMRAERMKFGYGVDLHTESNQIHLCTRPDVVVKCTRS
jgi:uncharacterized coiled-coil protein SlyX